MAIPMSFTSRERATTHPSFDDRSSTGLLSKSGRKSRSQETKKLLQSIGQIYDIKGLL